MLSARRGAILARHLRRPRYCGRHIPIRDDRWYRDCWPRIGAPDPFDSAAAVVLLDPEREGLARSHADALVPGLELSTRRPALG